MSSLREVKDRIASVRSTLKITSAMKLVASSKLRRAQRAIEALRPYEETLNAILAAAGGSSPRDASAVTEGPATSVLAISAAGSGLRPSNAGPSSPSPVTSLEAAPATEVGGSSPSSAFSLSVGEDSVILLAFSSNSSMCGAFNANVIKKTLELAREYEAAGSAVEIWAFGRKMAEGLRKAGRPAERDLSQLVSHPSFDEVAALAAELRERYEAGEVASVVLVYNHFVSTGRQEVVVEPYLGGFAASRDASAVTEGPATSVLAISAAGSGLRPSNAGPSSPSPVTSREVASDTEAGGASVILSEAKDLNAEDFIVEPSRAELVRTLLPQILNLKLYAALLDSAASEHAARMIAMQAATDNGEELLGELTLEYNKGRQQKITAEILDLVGAEV